MTPRRTKWTGFTHPVPMWALGLWRRFFCSREMHAFDEVGAPEGAYLSCDACSLEVHIARVDSKWRLP